MQHAIDLLKILKWSQKVEFSDLKNIMSWNQIQWWKNIYFCWWVKPWLTKRCNDDDIVMKKYFVIDIDIRLDCYKQTDIVLSHDEMNNHIQFILDKLREWWVDDYSAIVNSWNGIHLYYTWNERIFDKNVYSKWVQMIYEYVNDAIKQTWYKCDPACHNLARVTRLPWTINPRYKENKDKKVLWDLWDYVVELLYCEEKKSVLFESIEEYAKQYDMEQEVEKKDAVIIHKISKEYKKTNDIRSEINDIPACDIACDIRPVTTSDKWKDNVALKESKKNMGAYRYRPKNIIVNTWSSMIKTNKSYFTSYELVFYEYANQDTKTTLDYFKLKYNIEIETKKEKMDIKPIEYKRQWYLYWSHVFDVFDCVMSWELMVVVALSNTWKTTFAMDMIHKNVQLWKKCFYINLEFAIETVRQSRRLYANWYKKRNLTDLEPLSDESKRIMDDYVKTQLSKFDSYSNPQWLELSQIVEMIQKKQKEWYWFFVIDTLSRIEWNLDSSKAHTKQNETMQVLQDVCQKLWVVVVLLHHTNKKWEFEGSQKIMDLANVFIMMNREEWLMGDKITKFTLTKDKFVSYTELETRYENWEYKLAL